MPVDTPDTVRRRGSGSVLVAVDPAAARLDTRALNLRREAALASGSGGLCLLARLRPRGGLSQERRETGPGLGAIPGLGAMLAAVDQKHAIGGHPLSREGSQTRLNILGQRRRRDIEAQFHSGGDLVDVLATRTRSANEPFVQLVVGDDDRGRHVKHSGLASVLNCKSAGKYKLSSLRLASVILSDSSRIAPTNQAQTISPATTMWWSSLFASSIEMPRPSSVLAARMRER